ncbi:vacuolar protein sorting-associated protein 8-like [Heracleum sosnowskyi]|uniref:Vacuolar protein sorting-associated protein 8-like n=1 Tax=Heracleum sosnowskyi TaxID=360622 RepID=A0AAD8MDS3_9APIA|nr:vacuolar protein sorting-associated protein 8-like [Heracleum sosnowskyi]
MELDLDSLLNSNLSSDDDDDNNDSSNSHRRTVDEIILNDSSSSSSSSPKRIDISKTPALVKRSTELPYPDARNRNVLPSLFGSSSASVRSNVKPGAALAAAFAASRNAPSPHAAAIKLRRASASSAEVVSQPLSVQTEISSSVCDFDDAVRDFNDELLSSVDESIVREWIEECEVTSVSPMNVLTRDNFDLVLETHSTSTSLTIQEENKLEEYSVIPKETDFDVNAEGYVTEQNIDNNAPEYENGRVAEEDSISIPDEHDEAEGTPVSEKEAEVNLDRQDNIISSDGSEPFENVDMQLEKKGSGTTGEEIRLYLKPLDLAEELEKKYALTDSQGMKDAASQPMRLEGVHQGSTVLGYFDIDANNIVSRTISSETFMRDHGSAQVLAVHLNYIAIGMSKGVIICFPSKKSPPLPDSSDAKIVMLGIQGDRSHASVMAMCFNRQGDLLFAGYADGHYTVWDVQKATSLKIIKEHKAPVVHIFYLGLDSQANRQFNVVSGDSKGVIKVIHFKYVPWLNRISINKQVTLLDETTSTVVCASPLLSDDYSGGSVTSAQGSAVVNSSSIGSMMGGVVGGDWKLFEGPSVVEEGVVIFVSHQSALVAKVNPGVEVYAQLPRPDGVREGCMPYAAWKYMRQPFTSSVENVSEKTSERVGLLALAWDRKVQVARLVKSELKIYRKLTLKSSAVGVTWLDDQLLVVLTSDGQLCLFETEEGTVIHQTSFAVDGSRADDLIAHHAQFTNTSGIPEKAYHNCVAISGASIYVLGPKQLTVSRLLPWKERIEVLRKAGDWIGALNMAISLYNGATHGVIDFPRTTDEVNNTVMPYLVELLISYVDEVFSYISVAFCNQIGKLDQLEDSSTSGSVRSEIEEQFTRVGGVAVEFCVHIKRTDILFDEIHSRFVSVQHNDTFLELLEPYILNDKLGSLPPGIMQALVEHYSMKGWLQRIEQCVLHMDISSLDFNQVVRLCREHRLYGALIYLFNKGLDDFRTPLEELLVVLQNSQRDIAASIGYRMLVYLKYCFSGRSFPPGPGVLSPTRLQSVRRELVQFLLEDTKFPSSPRPASSCFKGGPNLYHLLVLDTEATLDVLRCAFVEDEVQKLDQSLPDSALSNIDSTKDNSMQNLSQKMVDVLAVIIDQRDSQTYRSFSNDDVKSNEIWPSEEDISHVVDFVAYYISCGKATVSKNILGEILVYLTSTSDVDTHLDTHPIVPRQNLEAFRKREKQVLQILEVVTETDWDASYLLSLCEEAQFYQVCGYIHAIGHQNLAALESYMKDADEPIHAFSYIRCTLLQLHGKESDAFKSEIMSRIPELVILSRESTFFIVVEHFGGDHNRALCEMDSHPKSLFLYLKTIMEAHTKGSLNFSCFRKGDNGNIPSERRNTYQPNRIEAYLERISEFPKFMRDNPVHVTDKIVEQYLELLCQYETGSVLKFLETFENYRVEHCLRLCQKMLDTTIQGLLSTSSMKSFNAVLQKKEVNDILDIVHTCIGLCQRNSPRMDFDDSESLWFRLLDSFCEPLIDSYSTRINSEGKFNTESLARSLDREENNSVHRIRWKLSRFQKGAHILRKLFSLFIKEIVEGMIGYVRLPTIMMKLLSDNGSQEFGDFKLTILGMLGTYDFERRILDTAKSLIDDDNYYTMSQLKKGASHGYGPKSLLCCICNCPLAKNSTNSRIQVFNCGHTTHLQCEVLENEAAQRGYSAGCPICIPKKNTQGSKSKSAYAEHGLVSRPLSRNQPAEGNSLHLNESEAAEGSYGYHPISRFEILTSLQKDNSLNYVDNTPQLRLAPPALYHEKVKNDSFSDASSSGKVKKGTDLSRGESSGSFAKIRKTSKSKQLRDLKLKGSSIRFPLKANIFGKEMISRRLH